MDETTLNIYPDALHKSRLLNVEDKPFKRITKRLLNPTSLLTVLPTLPPTPPPDAASTVEEEAALQDAERQKQLEDRRQFREDALLDFAAFESSIVRIQLLLTSNTEERKRYAAEKLKIQVTAQAVRDNTNELRVQLEEAQKTLALRKEYDELAEKITSNRMLRPREDQHANLDKLNAEIAGLEREGQEYAQTWAERRQQFGRIIEEGMQLRRLIRDEKEEVERREGMEDSGEDGEDGEAGSVRGRSSGFASPMQTDGGGTPLHPSLSHLEQHRETGQKAAAAGLTVAEQVPRAKTPLRIIQNAEDEEEGEGKESQPPYLVEDEEMAEDGEVSGEAESSLSSAPTENDIMADVDDSEGLGKGDEGRNGANGVMDTS